jgi:hypothetical protein
MSKKAKKIVDDAPSSGRCIGDCGKTLNGDYYCYGCKSFVCDDCDHKDPGQIGPHSPEAHDAHMDDD